MADVVSSSRPTALVVHDDGMVLDVMTRLFEANGFDVVTAVTGFRAQGHLTSRRRIDVVVAPWDLEHQVGGDLYRWALHERYDLRDHFVFIATEVPEDFDRVVAGRCLTVSPEEPEQIVQVAIATIRQHEMIEAARDASVVELDSGRPRLLLADDDPVLLQVMADFLSEAGFSVTCADSGHGAIAELGQDDFDAIVIDWHMDGGDGADVYRWLIELKPWLADRVVFLSDEAIDPSSPIAQQRPMFRKGQDSSTLTAMLLTIARQSTG